MEGNRLFGQRKISKANLVNRTNQPIRFYTLHTTLLFNEDQMVNDKREANLPINKFDEIDWNEFEPNEKFWVRGCAIPMNEENRENVLINVT